MSEDSLKDSKQFAMPWYAGVNIMSRTGYGSEADTLCSNYIQMLFIDPQSRAVELLLETLEGRRDACLIAQCLSDAMAYIAHTPLNKIKDRLVNEHNNPDYVTTHDFDHKQDELREALRMSPEEFALVVVMVTAISGELFMQGLTKALEVKIDPTRAAPIFEKVLTNGSGTNLQKAAALYLFLALPIKQELTELEMLRLTFPNDKSLSGLPRQRGL
ncbi:MAG TPA: hypothetical protein VJW95_07095 [Dissulfurispiraceae bacterium]|nr:hypothetical protein [Dissulfurispiraceae bacterium]